MLAYIAVALVVVVLTFLAYVSTRPDELHVKRSTTINAPPDRIYPVISDFRKWEAWSPWEKRDPALQRTYSGAADGAGAVYEWAGNNQVGSGRMEITSVKAPGTVMIDLQFIKPFEARNVAEFRIEPRDGQSVVTWGMQGKQAFMHKAFGVFMNMDDMIGRDFEAGLAMKSVVERS